jgi:hypothetical protein
MVKSSHSNVSKTTTVIEHETVEKVSVVDSNSSVVQIIEIDETSKSCSLPADQSDDSLTIIPNTSMAEDEQDSDLDASHVSNDELGKTTLSDKASTQRQDEREKKKLEKQKEKEVLVTIRLVFKICKLKFFMFLLLLYSGKGKKTGRGESRKGTFTERKRRGKPSIARI